MSRRLRGAGFLTLWLALTAPAEAHDLWLQPAAFHVAAGAAVPVTVQVGHGVDRQAWGVATSRVVALRSVGGSGAIDHRPSLKSDSLAKGMTLRFPAAGLRWLTLESTHATSELPPERFEAYLRDEGLTPAIEGRWRAGLTARPGREIYSRRAKALIEVGASGVQADRLATTPLGMTLEIVPERNPYGLKAGARLPVRVYYLGKPLAGALLKLTDLANDDKPKAAVTSGRDGRAVFVMPGAGAWLLNVVWTAPITGDPRGDFDTTFSSLTFGGAK